MRKIFALMSSLALLAPALALAQGVGQINGQGQGIQNFATTTGPTTMHLEIVSVGGTHTFRWDGTPWRVDQGGTGAQTFSAGALLVGNGTSPLSEVASGSLGQVLTWNGTFPVWANPQSSGSPAGGNKEIQFNNNGAFGADPKFTYDSATGVLLVGTTSPAGANDRWTFVGSQAGSITTQNLGIVNYSGTQFPSTALAFRTSRGSPTIPAAVQQNDVLGRIVFNGYDGNSFIVGGSPQIYATARENWTSSAHGSGLVFATVPLGSTARVDRLRIEPSGNIGLVSDGSFRSIRLDGVTSSGSSPFFEVSGSNNNGSGSAGVLILRGGDAVSGMGGDVHLFPGKSVTGIPGRVAFVNPLNTNSNMHIDPTNITAFRVVQFQDATGMLSVLEQNERCLAMKNADGERIYIWFDSNNAIQVAEGGCPF